MTNRYEFCIDGQPKLDAPHRVRAIGLPEVYIWNGVTIEEDPDHGKLTTIDDLDGLHQALALAIVQRRADTKLTGPEFRFLRKQMDLSQKTMAFRIGVNVQTIANYEKETSTNSGTASRLVCNMYVTQNLSGMIDARELRDAHASAALLARQLRDEEQAMYREVLAKVA